MKAEELKNVARKLANKFFVRYWMRYGDNSKMALAVMKNGKDTYDRLVDDLDGLGFKVEKNADSVIILTVNRDY